jgi:hypothetical protein
MAKALYGAQNGLDAALCGGTGCNKVVSRLVCEAYAPWRRQESAARARRGQFVVCIPAIYPSRHRFERNHTASRDRSAGLGDHLGLSRDTLFPLLRGFLARGGEISIGHDTRGGHPEKIGALTVRRHSYCRIRLIPPLLRFLVTPIRNPATSNV